MRRYETILIVRADAGEENTTAVLDKTTAIIQNDDGKILKIDKWGLRKLAYLIKKQTHGFYIYIEYAGKPETVLEIERVYKIDDRVLKYMTVKTQDTYIPDPEPGPEPEPEPEKPEEDVTSEQQETPEEE